MTTPVGIPRRGLGLVGAVMFLVAWELAARLLWRDAQALPAPSQALGAAMRHLTTSELVHHVAVSLGRIGGGFALGALAGITLGVTAGWYPWLGRLARQVTYALERTPLRRLGLSHLLVVERCGAA